MHSRKTRDQKFDLHKRRQTEKKERYISRKTCRHQKFSVIEPFAEDDSGILCQKTSKNNNQDNDSHSYIDSVSDEIWNPENFTYDSNLDAIFYDYDYRNKATPEHTSIKIPVYRQVPNFGDVCNPDLFREVKRHYLNDLVIKEKDDWFEFDDKTFSTYYSDSFCTIYADDSLEEVRIFGSVNLSTIKRQGDFPRIVKRVPATQKEIDTEFVNSFSVEISKWRRQLFRNCCEIQSGLSKISKWNRHSRRPFGVQKSKPSYTLPFVDVDTLNGFLVSPDAIEDWKKLQNLDWDELYKIFENDSSKNWIPSLKSIDFKECNQSIKLFLWKKLLDFNFDGKPHVKSLSVDGKDYFGILNPEKKEYALFDELPCIRCDNGFVAPKKFYKSEIFAQYNHLECYCCSDNW